MATSLVAHGLAFLLLALRLSPSTSIFTPNISSRQRITLLAPAITKRVVPLSPRVQLHRRFQPTLLAANLEPPIVPFIPAPAFEPPKPAAPELPMATVVPPVIPAVNFKEMTSAPQVAAPKLVVKPSGFQNEEIAVPIRARARSSTTGSFESESPAPDAAAPRRIAPSSGFADASLSPSTATHRNAIAIAKFGDSTALEENKAAPRRTTSARFTPVEILSKPKPAYTDEARAMKVEGEVLLEMEFSASGQAHVVRLVHGLGHGLDENAIAAALGIRFRPATRESSPVDASVVVHIVFQLAN